MANNLQANINLHYPQGWIITNSLEDNFWINTWKDSRIGEIGGAIPVWESLNIVVSRQHQWFWMDSPPPELQNGPYSEQSLNVSSSDTRTYSWIFQYQTIDPSFGIIRDDTRTQEAYIFDSNTGSYSTYSGAELFPNFRATIVFGYDTGFRIGGFVTNNAFNETLKIKALPAQTWEEDAGNPDIRPPSIFAYNYFEADYVGNLFLFKYTNDDFAASPNYGNPAETPVGQFLNDVALGNFEDPLSLFQYPMSIWDSSDSGTLQYHDYTVDQLFVHNGITYDQDLFQVNLQAGHRYGFTMTLLTPGIEGFSQGAGSIDQLLDADFALVIGDNPKAHLVPGIGLGGSGFQVDVYQSGTYYLRANGNHGWNTLSSGPARYNQPYQIEMDVVNRAPVIINTNLYGIEVSLPENQHWGPRDGVTVSWIANQLAGTSSDADGQSLGLVIYGVSGLLAGTPEYSTDYGNTWITINSEVSETNALLLDANTLLRYTPPADTAGDRIDYFRLWDGTGGYQSGSFVDLTSTGVGGAAPFSEGVTSMAIHVRAPIVDNGSSNDDLLIGDAANDSLSGGEGNDSILGSGGNDTIDGGAGADVADYSSSLSDYAIIKSGSQYYVSGADGNDTLLNVERLTFNDFSVNLTIQGTATSGVTADEVNKIAELYVAYFNRVPEADGLEYWINTYKNGVSMADISRTFYDVGIQYSELTGYTSSMSLESFIGVVYQNVLGRDEVDAGGLEFWVTSITEGRQTRQDLVASILSAAHTYKLDPVWHQVPDLLDNKIEVANYFAVQNGLNYLSPEDSITQGMAMAAGITSTDTTAAIELIGVHDIEIMVV